MPAWLARLPAHAPQRVVPASLLQGQADEAVVMPPDFKGFFGALACVLGLLWLVFAGVVYTGILLSQVAVRSWFCG